MFVGLLGILKAGGSHVALDAAAPQAGIARLTKERKLPFILIENCAEKNFPGVGTVIVYEEGIRSPADEDDCANGAPENVAYWAGANGIGGFAGVRHKAIAHMIASEIGSGIRPEDVVAQSAEVGSGKFSFEVWMALARGARLVIEPPSETLSVADRSERWRAGGITTLLFDESTFHQLADANPGFCRGMRQVVVAGGAVDGLLANEVFGKAVLTNFGVFMGPIESGSFQTLHCFGTEASSGNSPLGRPVKGTAAYLLNVFGDLASVGAVGELYFSDDLARGWFEDPVEDRFGLCS